MNGFIMENRKQANENFYKNKMMNNDVDSKNDHMSLIYESVSNFKRFKCEREKRRLEVEW